MSETICTACGHALVMHDAGFCYVQGCGLNGGCPNPPVPAPPGREAVPTSETTPEDGHAAMVLESLLVGIVANRIADLGPCREADKMACGCSECLGRHALERLGRAIREIRAHEHAATLSHLAATAGGEWERLVTALVDATGDLVYYQRNPDFRERFDAARQSLLASVARMAQELKEARESERAVTATMLKMREQREKYADERDALAAENARLQEALEEVNKDPAAMSLKARIKVRRALAQRGEEERHGCRCARVCLLRPV